MTSEIRTYQRRAFGRETRYQLHVEGEDARWRSCATRASCPRSLDRPPKRVVATGCCRAAYLRGALLGGGTLSGPRSPHLEVRSGLGKALSFVAEIAERAGVVFTCSTRAGTRSRTRRVRGRSRTRSRPLARSDAVLAFEEQVVMGATKARANRLANADHANLVRTSRAAQAQIRAVRRLERRGGVADVAPKLAEIARLRLDIRHFRCASWPRSAVHLPQSQRRNDACQPCPARRVVEPVECAILP